MGADGQDTTRATGGRPRLGRLFVSSVFGGMEDLRERVEESARLLGFTPVLAERAIAQSDDVASVLEREIASCDTYVGLFSKRRGTVPDGENWAITEQEFRLAREGSLRCLAFEDNQEPATGRPADPELGKALLDLAVLGGKELRLLFTTRHALELPAAPSLEVTNLDLGSLSPAESRKLKLLLPGLRGLDRPAWARVMRHLGGHPIEILAGYLNADPDRLPGLLDEFDEALDYVEEGLASEHQERGRKLLIDAVLAGVPGERLAALDRLCLLQAPLPDGELVELLAKTGVADPRRDLAWLRRQGLLARTVAPSALEGGDAVHRLIASRRQSALAEREGKDAAVDFHRAVADHLVQPGKTLKAQAGEIAEARHYQEERLAVNRQLGDIDGIAAALYDLAGIDLQEEKLADALPRLAEAWPLFGRIGRADAIAIVGELYGQLLAAAGRPEAIAVLEQSRQAYELLGWADGARQVSEVLAAIKKRE